MTVVGTAWVEIKAMGDKFGQSLVGSIRPGLSSAEGEVVSSSAKMKHSLSTMFSSISATGVLGPVSEITDSLGTMSEKLGEGRHSLSEYAVAGGAALTGVGMAMQSMASGDIASLAQLKASISATGGNFNDFKDKIDGVDKSNEKFGFTAAKTNTALNAMVLATHNPTAALKDMSVVTNLAAARHMSLSSAARIVGRVLAGNTGMLRQYGIAVQTASNQLVPLDKAQLGHAKAVNSEKSAQLAYNDMLAKFGAIAHPTEKQILALQAAHLKLKSAQQGVTASTLTLNASEHHMSAGQMQAQQSVQRLGAVLAGQASAQANTFTGHMDALKAKVEDTVAAFATKFGPAVTAAGPVLMGTGAVVQTGMAIYEKFGKKAEEAGKAVKTVGDAAKAASTATEALTGVTKAAAAGSAAMGAVEDVTAVSTEATGVAAEGASAGFLGMDVALAPVLAIGAAVVALGVGVYEAYEHFKPFRDIVNDVGRVFKTGFLDSLHAVEAAFKDVSGFFGKVFGAVEGIFKKYGTLILAAVLPVIGIPVLIFQHWAAIEKFFSGTFHAVTSKVEQFGKDFLHFISKAWSDVTGAFTHGAAVVEGLVTGFFHRMIAGFERLGSDILHAGERLWSDVTGAFSRGVNAVEQLVVGFVSREVSGFERLGSDILHAGERLWSDVTGAFSRGISGIERAVSGMASSVLGMFVRFGSEALGGMERAWSTITGAVGRGISDVKNAVLGMVADAGNWLLSAGSAIVQGLVHGIENAAGSVGRAVSHLASLVPKGIKDILKIFSPSQVVADLGRQIPAGMAAGITAAAPLAAAASASMVKHVLKATLDAHRDSVRQMTAVTSQTSYGLPAVGASRFAPYPNPVPAPRMGQTANSQVTSNVGTLLTDPAQVSTIHAVVQSQMAQAGLGGGPLPVVFVAGNLVVPNQSTVTQLSRSLADTATSVARAQGDQVRAGF